VLTYRDNSLFSGVNAATALLCLLAALAGCSGRQRVLDESLFAGADIIILGEVHDNPQHHRRQAELLTAIAPAAVAFEMLTPAQAATANATAVRDERLAEALDWAGSGWPDWSLYQPVFVAVGNTPVYGMAVPRESLNAAVTGGAASAFGEGAGDFGLTDPLPAAQQSEREAHQQAVHCNALPAAMLPGMVEAQRLRDAAFARTALEAHREAGGPVVVITGSGHARVDWGMPAMLREAAPEMRVVSIGQLEEQPAGAAPYDHWLVSEPAPRPDPCEGFAIKPSP
jgi:uncharacterized iron-regulated protein